MRESSEHMGKNTMSEGLKGIFDYQEVNGAEIEIEWETMSKIRL